MAKWEIKPSSRISSTTQRIPNRKPRYVIFTGSDEEWLAYEHFIRRHKQERYMLREVICPEVAERWRNLEQKAAGYQPPSLRTRYWWWRKLIEPIWAICLSRYGNEEPVAWLEIYAYLHERYKISRKVALFVLNRLWQAGFIRKFALDHHFFRIIDSKTGLRVSRTQRSPYAGIYYLFKVWVYEDVSNAARDSQGNSGQGGYLRPNDRPYSSVSRRLSGKFSLDPRARPLDRLRRG